MSVMICTAPVSSVFPTGIIRTTSTSNNRFNIHFLGQGEWFIFAAEDGTRDFAFMGACNPESEGRQAAKGNQWDILTAEIQVGLRNTGVGSEKGSRDVLHVNIVKARDPPAI